MLPKMPYIGNKYINSITGFKGLNLTNNFEDGEAVEAKNISYDAFPYIAPLNDMAADTSISFGTGNSGSLYAWNELVAVTNDGSLYYAGTKIATITAGRKQFATINTKICIFPDKCYIDTLDGTFHYLESVVDASGVVEIGSNYVVINTSTVGLVSIQADNRSYPTYTSAVYSNDSWQLEGATVKTASNMVMGDILLFDNNASGYVPIHSSSLAARKPHFYGVVLYKTISYVPVSYVPVGGMNPQTGQVVIGYAPVEYVRISVRYSGATTTSTDLTELFEVGDKVTIDFTGIDANKYFTISSVFTNRLTFSENLGITAQVYEDVTITVSRKIPDLDFVCVSNNRLWGVNRGENMIYASELGMPTRFAAVGTESTAAYSVAVASKGFFTACIAYGDDVLCFKEDILHRVSGSEPSNYYINDYNIEGIQSGSEKCTAIFNEVLYYKSRHGIYAYSGYTPTLISQKLGEVDAQGVSTACNGRKLYMSLQKNGIGNVYVYDLHYGLWTEYAPQGIPTAPNAASDMITDIVYTNGKLYMLRNGNELYKLSAAKTLFRFTFHKTDEGSRKRKKYKTLRMWLEMGASDVLTVTVYLDGVAKTYTVSGTHSGTYSIPLPPNRVNDVQIYMSATSGVVIKDITREYCTGSSEK